MSCWLDTSAAVAAGPLCGVGLAAHSKNLTCFLPSGSAAGEDARVHCSCASLPPHQEMRRFPANQGTGSLWLRREPSLALEVLSRGRGAEDTLHLLINLWEVGRQCRVAGSCDSKSSQAGIAGFCATGSQAVLL